MDCYSDLQSCCDCDVSISPNEKHVDSIRIAKKWILLLTGVASISILASTSILNKGKATRVGAEGRSLLAHTPSAVFAAYARTAASRNVQQEGRFRQVSKRVSELRGVLKETDACNDCLEGQKILADMESYIGHIQSTSRATSIDLHHLQSRLTSLIAAKEQAVTQATASAKAAESKLKWAQITLVCFVTVALGAFFRKRLFAFMQMVRPRHCNEGEEEIDIEIKGELSSLSLQQFPQSQLQSPDISGAQLSYRTTVAPKRQSSFGVVGSVEEAHHSENEVPCGIKESTAADASGSDNVSLGVGAKARSKPCMGPLKLNVYTRHPHFTTRARSRGSAPMLSMQHHSKCEQRYRAIVRLLQVEAALLWRRVALQASGDTTDDLQDELEARAPLIHWSMTQLLKRAVGIHPSVLGTKKLNPFQVMLQEHLNMSTPTLGSAIKTLKPQLTREVVLGLRTSPLQVLRLVWFGVLLHLTGPQHGVIRRCWPDALENLAETMESNLRTLLRKQRFHPFQKRRHGVRKGQIKQSRYLAFYRST